MEQKQFVFNLAMTAGFAVGVIYMINSTPAGVPEVQLLASSTRNEWLGHTTNTDYIAAGKQLMTEQAKFLAVNVVRDYDFIEHVEVSRLGLTSTATVIVSYNVEYSFGFDLKPDSFDIQAGPSGIELRIGSPILVAAPAVMPANFEIPDKGYFVDEKAAIIAIHHRLPGIARAKGLTMAQDAEIRAVCEKKLLEFLREFLGKQPGVKQVPAITVAYR